MTKKQNNQKYVKLNDYKRDKNSAYVYELDPSPIYRENMADRDPLSRVQDRAMHDILHKLCLYGSLIDRSHRSHKLKNSKDIIDEYGKGDVYDCHVGGNNELVLLYRPDYKAKKVELLNIGTHKELKLRESYVFVTSQVFIESALYELDLGVEEIELRNDYTMRIRFSNDEVRTLDVKPMIRKDAKAWPLRKLSFFMHAAEIMDSGIHFREDIVRWRGCNFYLTFDQLYYESDHCGYAYSLQDGQITADPYLQLVI